MNKKAEITLRISALPVALMITVTGIIGVSLWGVWDSHAGDIGSSIRFLLIMTLPLLVFPFFVIIAVRPKFALIGALSSGLYLVLVGYKGISILFFMAWSWLLIACVLLTYKIRFGAGALRG